MKKCSPIIPGIAVFAMLLSVLIIQPNPASATKAQLSVEMSTPVVLNRSPQTAFLKVGVTGFALVQEAVRPPVNVAIVIDRSGSMSGEKMARAQDAAIMAIDRLGPDDIVSVVAYSHVVEVIVPATKVDDKEHIYQAIRNLYASGTTALFAGVSKGARQVRKFLADNRANRIILVSDGLANVGPSSPTELGSLGHSLAKEGISVTTIGLGDGYNEDLMAALAGNSDGNHAFVENAADLATTFNYEFGDLLSIVARNVRFKVQFNKGITPIRVLGRNARIHGRTVTSTLTQLYANQEKFMLIEVQIAPGASGEQTQIGSVDITYSNTVANSTDVLSKNVYVSFTDNWNIVEEHRNDDVMVASVELIAAEAQKTAITLRDKGQTREAERALEQNAVYLDSAGKKYNSARLKKQAQGNRTAKKNLAPSKWKRQRKAMVDDNYALETQQNW
ncbi:MAG: VWA domain-containing protein [Deltaproteobacteria bacterium]|nr:VWA domain-containing protein [Deltaproteobacteria bacterium]MBN2671362.1 VWA domain-containing protein [Deltaproteobacteria bacterium]